MNSSSHNAKVKKPPAGKIMMDGSTHEVVSTYLRSGKGKSSAMTWEDRQAAPGADIARLRSVSIRNEAGDVSSPLDIRKPIYVQIEFECLKPGHVLTPSFSLWNEEGFQLFTAMDLDPMWRGKERPVGRYVCKAKIPGNLLAEGTMSINTGLWEWEPRRRMEYYEQEVVAFQVIDNLEGDSSRGDYIGNISGAMRPMLDWVTDFQGTGG